MANMTVSIMIMIILYKIFSILFTSYGEEYDDTKIL